MSSKPAVKLWLGAIWECTFSLIPHRFESFEFCIQAVGISVDQSFFKQNRIAEYVIWMNSHAFIDLKIHNSDSGLCFLENVYRKHRRWVAYLNWVRRASSRAFSPSVPKHWMSWSFYFSPTSWSTVHSRFCRPFPCQFQFSVSCFSMRPTKASTATKFRANDPLSSPSHTADF